jgi:hypothetical protein
VRRYCLPCSKKTGRLVERKCLVAEKAAVEAREKSAALRSETAKRQRTAVRERWTAGGVDIRRFAKRCWIALTTAKYPNGMSTIGQLTWRMPKIGLTRSTLHPKQAAGHGAPRRVTLRFGHMTTRAAVEMVVLHELCHAVRGRGEGGWHDAEFNRLMSKASIELFDIGLPIGSGYGPSRFLERALAKRYGELTIYPLERYPRDR